MNLSMSNASPGGEAEAAARAAGEAEATVKAAWGVSALTMLSRVLGFARLIIMVHLFANLRWASDAFLFAFRIPNIFRNLLGEGALSAAFIPAFVKTRQSDGPVSASVLGSQILTLLAAAGGGIAAVGAAIALAASYFAAGQEATLAFQLTAILFPFMPLICLAALLAGMLQSLGRFRLPAAASCIMNVGFLAGYAYVYWVQCGGDLSRLSAFASTGVVALGVLAAGAAEVIVLARALRAGGIRVGLTGVFTHPGLRQTMRSFAPVALGLGVVQINALCDSFIAGWIALSSPGAVTYLEIAFRFMQLPLGVFGVAIATVSFPALAGAAENRVLFTERLVRSARMSLFFALPAAAVLISLADPIVRLAYQTPDLDFSHAAVYRTSAALILYSAGLGFYSLRQIFVRGHYALGDYRYPVRIAIVMAGANLVLNLILIHCPDLYRLYFPEYSRHWNLTPADFPWGIALGEAGLALATLLTAGADCLLLGLSLRKKLAGGLPPATRNAEGRRLLHTAVRMGFTFAVLLVLTYLFRNSIPYEPGFWPQLSRVAFSGALAAGTFYIIATVLPLPEMEEFLVSALRRKKVG